MDTTNTNTGVDTTTEESTPKTYTQEEVDKLLQQEGDRRVTEALKKAEKKNQDKVKEAQRLAQMNEQEKYEYQLQQREEAIKAKEKELSLAENKNEASKILAEKGISLSLVDFVVADDADTMKANIDLLTKAFNASVKAEVEKRLGSNNPKKNLQSEGSITKEQFRKMNIAQQSDLFKTNPDLYKRLVAE